MNFKAGDKIRQKEDCSGAIKGEIYELTWGDKYGICKNQLYAWKGGELGSGGRGCSCQENWELVESPKDIIIHTPTQEEYNQVVQRCLDLGGKVAWERKRNI